MDDPALNSAVINGIASLLHQLFHVAVAERISHVPADALENDILLVMAAFETDQNLSNYLDVKAKSIA
jgi:hypothetical protein